MAKIIDKNVVKEINDGLKMNYITGVNTNSYALPKFVVNEKGEYFYAGVVNINNYKDFNKYMKTYSAIAKYIKQNYSSTISKIYKNALNSLVSAKDPYMVSQNEHSLVSKLENKVFSVGKFASESVENYEETLGFITKAGVKSNKLKPCKEVIEIIKSEGRNLTQSDVCILPQIGTNGVILKQSKLNSNQLEAQFELLSRAEVKEIESFMLQTADSLDNETATRLKTQISKVFSQSRNIGSRINHASNGIVAELQDLAKNLIDLVGVDLSSYEKGAKKAAKKKAKASNLETSAPETQSTVTSNKFNADEILIRGTYKATPTIQGDVIVTKITPDGVKFDVAFDGNKLFVASEKSNDDNSFGM